jgi:hypothetical protein
MHPAAAISEEHRQMRLSKVLSVLALFGVVGSAASASALDIAWMTFHSADNMPSAGAGTGTGGQGFTTAPDKGYTDVLTAAGHNVTRVVTSDSPDINALNGFDLVIIGRSVNSGNYETDTETENWNSKIHVPVLVMNGYVMRNVRLGFTTGGTIPDTGGTPTDTIPDAINLQVNSPSHPIFAGVSISGGVTTNPYTTGLVTMPVGTMTTQRGISVNTDAVAGNGTVLATVAGMSDPAAGGTIIAEWQPGALMGTTPTDVLEGHRVVFLSGSREHAAVDNPAPQPDLTTSSEISGMYDLTATGQQMFLNAVNYTAGLGFVVPGDVNRNGVTDIGDYNIIRDNFLATNRTRAQGDLIDDNVVNLVDFRYWKNNRTPGAAGSELSDEALLAGLGVPEPGSLALILFGAFAWLAASRRRAG